MLRTLSKFISSPKFNRQIMTKIVNLHATPPNVSAKNSQENNNNNTKIYTENHDWLLDCGKYYKLGISNQALEELSEVIYVEFYPETNYELDDTMVAIESVKAVADIRAPFNCEIIEKNEALEEDYSCLNENPECEHSSWILKLKKL